MKECVLGFFLIKLTFAMVPAVENLTEYKTLLFIGEETGITQYCEFGTPESFTALNGEYSQQCYLKNKGMRYTLPDGTILWPYLKPNSNNGLVLKCEEMENVILKSCSRQVYSTCNFSCPDGFASSSNTTTCDLLGPLRNVTVQWSNHGRLCVPQTGKVMGATDTTRNILLAMGILSFIIFIIVLGCLYKKKHHKKPSQDDIQLAQSMTGNEGAIELRQVSPRNSPVGVDSVQEDPQQEDPPQRNSQVQVDGENIEQTIELPQHDSHAQVSQRNSLVEVDSVQKGFSELPMNFDTQDAHQTDRNSYHKNLDEKLKRYVEEFDAKLDSDKEPVDGERKPSTSIEAYLSDNGRCQALGVRARALPNEENSETATLLEKSGQRLCIDPCSTSVNLFLKQSRTFVDSLSSHLEYFEGRPVEQTVRGFVMENLRKLRFETQNDVLLFVNRCQKGYEVEGFLHRMAGADILIGDFLDYCNKHTMKEVISTVLSVHKHCAYCFQYRNQIPHEEGQVGKKRQLSMD